MLPLILTLVMVGVGVLGVMMAARYDEQRARVLASGERLFLHVMHGTHGMAWYGTACIARMAWHSVAWYGMARHGIHSVHGGMAWHACSFAYHACGRAFRGLHA